MDKREIYNYEDLPFVNRKGSQWGKWSDWDVKKIKGKKIKGYGKACEIGQYYAVCYLQYLINNPATVGSNSLGNIAKHIDFDDETNNKGYWVGFFSYLETFLHRGAIHADIWATLEHIQHVNRQRMEWATATE